MLDRRRARQETVRGVTAFDNLRTLAAAASERAILRRSVLTCLIVGALLTLINQGDALIRGAIDSTMVWKIGLTFVVPFVVATLSGAAAVRPHLRSGATQTIGPPGDPDGASGQGVDRR